MLKVEGYIFHITLINIKTLISAAQNDQKRAIQLNDF